MNVRRFSVVAQTALVASLTSAPVFADITKDQCIDANGKGQELRREGKLSEARGQLRACATPSCPAMVRDDCARRLDELETAQPTIIFEATDASGRDISGVQVTVDELPLVERLDGTAVRVDPGEHVFTFTAAKEPSLTRTFIIREGQKERREPLVIGPVAASPEPAQQTATVVTVAAASAQTAPNAGAVGPSNRWKTAGWVMGAAGVVGLGIGAVFGIVATGDKNAAHCVNDVCDHGTVPGIKNAARASDVGWIAGGLLLAGGAALVLFAPRAGAEPAAGLRLAPVVATTGAGIVAEESW